MNPYNYLIDHAITNAWCNREQDNRYIFKPKKISRIGGELNSFTFTNSKLDLPNTNKRYHVYQIGQISPKILGLLPKDPIWAISSWIPLDEVMNQESIVINIYTTEGIEITKFNSYYTYTRSNGLIFAIENNSKFNIDFEQDDLYFRLYSNAFFSTDRADTINDYIFCYGKKSLANNNEILNLQNLYNTYKVKRGFTFSYVNGNLVNDINLLNIEVGDTAEFVYDSSVKRTVRMKIQTLPNFSSILDNKHKYLLHYPKTPNEIIEFYDDIDIHILSLGLNNSYIGRYYNSNMEDSIRMVTHKDYSVPVDYVAYVGNSLNLDIFNNTKSISDFYIDIKIRDSGYSRPLIQDSNRIFELYKLTDVQVIQAMVGVNSVLAEWKAENLENSNYVKLMNSFYNDININLVEHAYGYNSISKILADTPNNTFLFSDNQVSDLPYSLQTNSTIYEYDTNGILIGRYYHANGSRYTCVNPETRMIEGICGRGASKPKVLFGESNIPIPTDYSYRVYKSHLTNGLPDNDWSDVTGSNLYTVNSNNILIKANDTVNTLFMVRDDSTFLAHTLNITPIAGTLYFTLSEIEDRGTGNENYVLPVPLGDLHIFLNGRSLIKDLDYFVKFPKVYIINKNYLVQPSITESQKIEVRFTGFSNSNLELDKVEDYGFIEHGFLSNNNRYDIRDDKVLHISLDGEIKQRNDLLFSEEHTGISVSNPINGLPYQIKDIIVPMRSLINGDTYNLRNLSLDLDERLSNIMTLKKPQPPRNAVSSIPQKYVLVSPFICHIAIDLLNNEIDNNLINKRLTDNEILSIVSIYTFLLDFDPIRDINNIDYRYVDIHPHSLNSVISINAYQYKFLSRVVDLFCNNLISLSPFITIST